MPETPTDVTDVTLRSVRGFGTLLTASTVSSVGDGVRLAALPLLALTITKDPLAIAGLAIANRLPWFGFSLISGVIADRYRRQVLMVLVDAARALLVVGLVSVVVTGSINLPLLYLFAVCLGVGETLFDSASHALLPDLVPGPQLARANGRLFTAHMVASNFVGPPLGSAAFAVGRALPFVVDAVSFAAASALVATVRVEESVTSAGRDRKSIFVEVGEGISWLIKHPLLRSFAVIVSVVNLTQGATQSILALYVTQDLGLAASVFGVVLAANGAGAFFGGMLAGRASERLGAERVILPAIAITLPLFLIAAWTRQPAVLATVLAVNTFFGILANVLMASLRQQIVPRTMLGRLMSVNRFLSFGIALPAGALAAGVLGREFGLRSVWLASAGVIAVLLVLVGRSLMPDAIKAALAQAEQKPPVDPQ